MNDTELAWAAGFIDGEGCFSLHQARGKGCHSTTRQPGLSVAQRRKEPLDRLVDMFGGSVGANGTRAWQWQVSGAGRLMEIIPLLLPFLVVKQGEAVAVLAYSRTVRRRGKTPISGVERKLRQEIIDSHMLARQGFDTALAE